MRAAVLKGTVMSAATLASFTVFHRHQRRGAETLWNEGRGAESGFQTILIHERRGAGPEAHGGHGAGRRPKTPELPKHQIMSKMHPKTDSQDPNMIYTEFRTF